MSQMSSFHERLRKNLAPFSIRNRNLITMIKVAILLPVLRRPQNIYPLVESILNTTNVSFDIVFIVSPGDYAEISELDKLKQPYLIMEDNYEGRGDYARKINAGFEEVEAEWYFTGADDIRFHANWFEEAMRTHDQTGACVVGTNDLGSPVVTSGQHATHSLVLRDYVLECGTIDEPGKIFHEGYKHNFVDTELVQTAQWRGAWAFSRDSIVAHNHPDWRKGKTDDVYQIGKNTFRTDQQYFETRKRLWT